MTRRRRLKFQEMIFRYRLLELNTRSFYYVLRTEHVHDRLEHFLFDPQVFSRNSAVHVPDSIPRNMANL